MTEGDFFGLQEVGSSPGNLSRICASGLGGVPVMGTQQTGQRELLLPGGFWGVWRGLRALGGRHLGTCVLCVDLNLTLQFFSALEANYPEILKNLIIVKGE